MEVFLKIITHSFSFTEYDEFNGCTFVIGNQFYQKLLKFTHLLFEIVDDVDDLCNIFVYGKSIMTVLVSNLNVDWVDSAETGSQFLDFFWPGGGEHQCLSVLALDHVNEFDHILFETHVKHAIGLVQDQVGASVQIGLSVFQKV